MSVNGGDTAMIDKYQGVDDIVRWYVDSVVAGDATGGFVSIIGVIPFNIFPQYYFTFEWYNFWNSSVAANMGYLLRLMTGQYGKYNIGGLQQQIEWTRVGIVTNLVAPGTYGENIDTNQNFLPPENVAWRPNILGTAPSIQVVFATNTNGANFRLSAGGHIYDSRTIAKTRKLF